MQEWQGLVRNGNLCFAERDFVGAKRSYRSALSVARRGLAGLADHDPQADSQLAACVVCALNLADALVELGDPATAIDTLLGVEAILAGLLGGQPDCQVAAPIVLRHLNRLRLERMVLMRSEGGLAAPGLAGSAAPQPSRASLH